MEYRPLGNRLIIEPIEIQESEKVNGTIIIPDSAIILQRGKVLAVGRGEVAPQTGAIVPCESKVGDIVLFRIEAPSLPIRLPNKEIEYKLMRENDVECIC